jgi:hypothetical protein
VVLWDPARLVNAAALMAAAAVLVDVAELVAVSAKVEGSAVLGVVAALTAPSACVILNAGAIGPGVVEDVAAFADFFRGHGVDGGILEDHSRGQPVVGVCLREGDCAVAALPLQVEEVLPHFGDAEGGRADARVDRAVADNLRFEGVVLFEGDGVVNQPCERLVRGEGKLLLFS